MIDKGAAETSIIIIINNGSGGDDDDDDDETVTPPYLQTASGKRGQRSSGGQGVSMWMYSRWVMKLSPGQAHSTVRQQQIIP